MLCLACTPLYVPPRACPRRPGSEGGLGAPEVRQALTPTAEPASRQSTNQGSRGVTDTKESPPPRLLLHPQHGMRPPSPPPPLWHSHALCTHDEEKVGRCWGGAGGARGRGCVGDGSRPPLRKSTSNGLEHTKRPTNVDALPKVRSRPRTHLQLVDILLLLTHDALKQGVLSRLRRAVGEEGGGAEEGEYSFPRSESHPLGSLALGGLAAKCTIPPSPCHAAPAFL